MMLHKLTCDVDGPTTNYCSHSPAIVEKQAYFWVKGKEWRKPSSEEANVLEWDIEVLTVWHTLFPLKADKRWTINHSVKVVRGLNDAWTALMFVFICIQWQCQPGLSMLYSIVGVGLNAMPMAAVQDALTNLSLSGRTDFFKWTRLPKWQKGVLRTHREPYQVCKERILGFLEHEGDKVILEIILNSLLSLLDGFCVRSLRTDSGNLAYARCGAKG